MQLMLSKDDVVAMLSKLHNEGILEIKQHGNGSISYKSIKVTSDRIPMRTAVIYERKQRKEIMTWNLNWSIQLALEMGELY